MTNYSKIRKIILFSLAGLLAAIILISAICVIYANSKMYDNVEPTEFYSKWMSYISDNALVREVVIPGSHDAGTHTLNWTAKTQDYDLMTQLKSGTRYFDLRVEKYKDELFIFHTFRGALFEPMLRQIKTFLLNNKSEMVILDFQHFKGDSHADVLAMLDDILGSTYYVTNYSSTTTDADYMHNLKMASVRGKCIVFWGSESDAALNKNYVFQRNNNEGTRLFASLHSYYDGALNKMSSKKYIENGLPTYIEKYKNGTKGLFVLQGQLTDGLFVFGPRFRERSHYKNMDQYVIGLSESADLAYINIIMRDFVTVQKNSYALELNLHKSVLKSTSYDTFATELKNFIDITYDANA